jgi:NADH-quinone oxidoreductase subunit I
MALLGKGLLEGMAVTARNFFGSYFDNGRKERLFTYQYPEERMPLPENSRRATKARSRFLVYEKEGAPVDTMRCVACKICETECPPQCIYIVMDRDEKGKPRQRPRVFDIDISVCMQCQICVEVCPFDAIMMDNDYEKSQSGRFDDLVEHLPDLLKSNAYYHRIKPTEAAAVDARLKAEAEKKAKKAAPAPKMATPPVAVENRSHGAAARKIVIPEDAPFNPEQRAWLAGFLSSLTVPPVAPSGQVSAPAEPATKEAEAPAPVSSADAPWHDPGLGLDQRMDLAKERPFADKLMAAMAQTDCHACGYDCRGYADAIASGQESDVSLCLPGEAETENKLKELMKEAGKG